MSARCSAQMGIKVNRFEYIVADIDGDYAHLRRTDAEGAVEEPKLVARALLPPEITEGSRLIYEYMEYRIAGGGE